MHAVPDAVPDAVHAPERLLCAWSPRPLRPQEEMEEIHAQMKLDTASLRKAMEKKQKELAPVRAARDEAKSVVDTAKTELQLLRKTRQQEASATLCACVCQDARAA